MRTITLKELEKQYTGTYSVKADTPRGRREKSFYNLQVGDEVLINNYFTLIIEEEEQEGEDMEELKSYEELVEEAIEILKDEEVFVRCCEELDSWNGFLDDNRLYSMDELDDLFCGCPVSEFASKIGRDFDFRDNYIQFTIYGIESTNSTPYKVYRDIYDEGDILDEILDKHSNLGINWIDSNLDEILDKLEEIKAEA